MDDAKNEKKLETLIQAVRIYSQNIGMEYGREKCAMLIMRSRKWQMMKLPNQENIRMLREKESYKYFVKLSKVGDLSLGWLKGSLFDSYPTEV